MSKVIGTPLYKLSEELKEEIYCLKSEEVGKEKNSPDASITTEVVVERQENSLLHFACSLCKKDFSSLEEQKIHYKSQEHIKNIKNRLKVESDDSDSEEEEEKRIVKSPKYTLFVFNDFIGNAIWTN